MSRLPPLNPIPSNPNQPINTQNEFTITSNARQRRRERLMNQSPSPNRDRSVENNQSHLNRAFEGDVDGLEEKNHDELMSQSRRIRRVRKRAQPTKDDETVDPNKPPQPRKKSRRMVKGANFATSSAILAGLEDDVVDIDDETKKDGEASDLSQRQLIQQPFESVPTDKFYLEMEKKFTIQNKNRYEKKQEERMRQINEAEMKRKLREELKFQISTPRTALKTHKFLRALFLLIQGVNIGFLIWQAVVIYTVNVSSFNLNLNSQNIPDQLSYFYVFRDLTMPVHCLSYFFLTICIIDCMDRYFVKCISFQNQFWSIIFYMTAILASLSIIFIDESVYISLFLDKSDPFNRPNATILNNINTNVQVWRAIGIVKASLALFAWLLCSVFVGDDKTCESLEKRDLDVLDDIAMDSYQTNKPEIPKDEKPAANKMIEKF